MLSLLASFLLFTFAADGPAPETAAAGLPAPSVNTRTGVRWYRDLHYVEDAAAHPAQTLDLYLPRADDSDASDDPAAPLLVWIHGGGWIMGDKDDANGVYGRYCRHLAERGVAVANVNYRLSPEVAHPAHVEDIAAAIAWLAERADELGFDASGMFISGHSAGGHLCALVAVDGTYLEARGLDVHDTIAGVIPSSGVFDLAGGWGSAFAPADGPSASPPTHVDRNDPPFLLIVEEYGAFMQNQTSLMAAALTRAGVAHDTVEIPKSHHITMLTDLLDPEGIHLTSTLEFIRKNAN